MFKSEAINQMKVLRNIGIVSATQLVEAGIDTPEKLKELGAKEALFMIFQKRGNPKMLHPCYLYALDGAINNCAWNAHSEEKKADFKQYIKDLKASY